ncbi:putative disease resistance protein RGA3 [Hordeum vulgare]|nr:putative disease resistance protein RGA3 [Hordeum vulgare]
MSESWENLGKQDAGVGATSNLLERLTFQDDETDDLIWEEELEAEDIKLKWWFGEGLIQIFSQISLTVLEIGIRLYTRGHGTKGHEMILAEYDGFTNPEKVKLDKIETWCQIHKLPDGVLKSERALGNLAQRIGEVQKVQVTLPNGFAGEFIRVRVKLDVNKKLTRVVGITKGGELEKYLVKFEKLPTFCHACGLMGHWYEECDTGEHDVAKFEWGNFFLAPRRGRGGGRGGRSNGGRGRDSRPFGPSNGRGDGDDEDDWAGALGRGRGRGMHDHANWRYNTAYNQPTTTHEPGGADKEALMTENAGNLSLDETRMQVVVAMDTNVLGK